MFRSIVRRAFDNWPETHPFRPENEDHLYGWLLIEVGYSECQEVETDDIDLAKAVVKAIFAISQREIHCMRIYGTPTGVRVCVPQSAAYQNAGKRKFEQMRAAVYEVIETTLGVKIEELKRAKIA